MLDSHQKLVIGVSHSLCYLDNVIKFLMQERIIDKKVMLELAKHRVSSEPQRNGLGFFRKLGDFVLESGGILIYGDDEVILERAYRRNMELCEKMRRPGLSIMGAELDCENRYEVPHTERDPHFLKIVQEQNPDVVVLGRRHIPHLIRNHYSFIHATYREVYIPEKE